MALSPKEVCLSEQERNRVSELEHFIDESLKKSDSIYRRIYYFSVSKPSDTVLTELCRRYMVVGWSTLYYENGLIVLVR